MIPREPLLKLIDLALAEDFEKLGDVTSCATLLPDKEVTGRITAKATGVIAGLEAVKLVYAAIDPAVQVKFHINDGECVEPSDSVCEVRGSAISVLAGERTALNFLQRLSGIATLTQQFVQAVADTEAVILDTRKTHPGWRLLDKYAVRMGGGQNHRMGLYDMVLIKDNHIDAAGSITAAVEAVRIYPDAQNLPIIVEVKNEAELRETLALKVDRILLDNMSLAEMQKAVEITGGQIPLEASGNVNLNRVHDIALTGIDFISAGALTHSAPVLDLSMRLLNVN